MNPVAKKPKTPKQKADVKVVLQARVDGVLAARIEQLVAAKSDQTVSDWVRKAVENEASRALCLPKIVVSVGEDQLDALTKTVSELEAQLRLHAAIMKSIAQAVGVRI